MERTIKALDFDTDEENFEVFCWRKDYGLHDFVGELLGGIENCDEKILDKENLIVFLDFLKDRNGNDDEHWKGETLDYDKEIEVLSGVIKNYDNKDWVYYYYYWAWW